MKHQIRITLFAVACLVSEVHAQDPHNPPDVNLERARQILTMARRDVFQHAHTGERGLLGLALAPDYPVSGRLYVNFTNPQGHTVVARFLRSAGNPVR